MTAHKQRKSYWQAMRVVAHNAILLVGTRPQSPPSRISRICGSAFQRNTPGETLRDSLRCSHVNEKMRLFLRAANMAREYHPILIIFHEKTYSDSRNSGEVILQKWRSSQNVFCEWRGLGILLQQAICVVCDHTHCLPLPKSAFLYLFTRTN